MEIIIYIVCFLLCLKYFFVLTKYIKTGEYKKKIFKGNILGIIAYTFLTILIISFLIIMILVSKDKSNELVMWILFISALGAVIMYPWFWKQRIYDKARVKDFEINQNLYNEFNNKYGSEEYDEFKVEHFDISDDVIIDERFNSLISLITNNQISFIHPQQYNNIADVFTSLYQQDYIKFLNGAESINLTCDIVNTMLKKNNINFSINSKDITKDDDEFIIARRKNLVPTMSYDLYKIDEIIKKNFSDYELVAFRIYDNKGLVKYPTYLCIMKKSKYDIFFKTQNEEMENNNEQ